jgi:hypothetical protein
VHITHQGRNWGGGRRVVRLTRAAEPKERKNGPPKIKKTHFCAKQILKYFAEYKQS